MFRRLALLICACVSSTPVAGEPPSWWRPEAASSFQWQLSGRPIDQSVDAAIYDVDLFETPAAMVASLHAHGRKAICYLSAGSFERWRPDAGRFPAEVIGKDYPGWPGEKWLDIRRLDLLAPILRARLDLCKAKGFDGVEPDNVDGYQTNTGFALRPADQLRFNRWLAAEAHARGLSVGLKNDGDQVAELVRDFDWALTEACFAEGWCQNDRPFAAAGKPVFMVEYSEQTRPDRFSTAVCPAAARMGFTALLKRRELDAYHQECRR